MDWKWFALENFVIAPGFEYQSAEYDAPLGPVSDYRGQLWSLYSEYQISESPISLFALAEYQSGKYQSCVDIKDDARRIMIGVKFDLNSSSLLYRDRHGASQNPLSNIYRTGGGCDVG